MSLSTILQDNIKKHNYLPLNDLYYIGSDYKHGTIDRKLRLLSEEDKDPVIKKRVNIRGYITGYEWITKLKQTNINI